MNTYQNEEIITMALSEKEVINQLQHLGVVEDMCVEVHVSFNSVGTVIGGPTAFVDALLKTVGSNGTIVMASQDYNNSEPLFWENPPAEIRLMSKIRENTPGYDIYTSGQHLMGIVTDNLRARKSTYHSYHPNSGFIANGKDAKYLMANQPLNFPLSMRSPLGKMYEKEDSYILLIGVGYDKATGLHLGEHLSECRNIILQGGAVKKGGETIWKKYLDIELDSTDFIEIGREMERRKMVRVGKVGNAICRLFRFAEAVDFTRDYLKERC
ncbi:MAG TPA: AAC(3) family N-acetyltransferase [Erysipelotrichaceae bacterium]|nr:AAC(3) family N-acetyltransferase [Erysipelotrichaceae bacterium]HQB32559.1 AAC(3) family N-acetyltransferase [Erysipelotrichaceae bacterium]